MSKLPEMLCRWHVFENLARGTLRLIAQGDLTHEEGIRWIDQLMAATTLRGDIFDDTSQEDVNIMWATWETEAKRTYPKDRRIRNS